ncbi:riboflavin synthase [Thioalkalivibrio paradoxus]|uniref:Riboflavin synthase n=1 Tax=Thioalkalivibrio paradoxus ARh 1 TaxID=713585 RepID=W0DL84_9GAMM|nr:riboflavin synthase [Thioalkalivibrio paradoxus]AHE97748.1 riboflavin synthase subunit alpha [Thioalkalivibrio paradoxus ARh 1]
MFTGIIETLGSIAALEPRGGDLRLKVRAPGMDLSDTQLGDSISVNGVCLTVTALEGGQFAADVSRESLGVTTLGDLAIGDRVNLERALTLNTRLGGHLVSGHVDGVGELVSMQPDARSTRVRFRAPDPLARYIAAKGSITIDGTSLTVNAVDGASFDVNIIPHTWSLTRFSVYRVGTRVNLEVDLIARYLERLMLGERAAQPGGAGELSESWLAEQGFANHSGPRD